MTDLPEQAPPPEEPPPAFGSWRRLYLLLLLELALIIALSYGLARWAS